MTIDLSDPLFYIVRDWIFDKTDGLYNVHIFCSEHNIDWRQSGLTLSDELLTYILLSRDFKYV